MRHEEASHKHAGSQAITHYKYVRSSEATVTYNTLLRCSRCYALQRVKEVRFRMHVATVKRHMRAASTAPPPTQLIEGFKRAVSDRASLRSAYENADVTTIFSPSYYTCRNVRPPAPPAMPDAKGET